MLEMSYLFFLCCCVFLTLCCHQMRLKAYAIFLGENFEGKYLRFRNLTVFAFLLELTGLAIVICLYWHINGPLLKSKDAYMSAIWLWTALPITVAVVFEIWRVIYERKNKIPHIIHESRI